MLVPMMQVGKMRMGVNQRLVDVLVPVWLRTIPRKCVIVAMVRVVAMRVIVGPAIVDMGVAVALGQVQPDATRQQRQRDEKRRNGTLAEEREGHRHPDEWRRPKVSTGPGSAELAQRDHEPDQTYSVTEKADERRRHRSLDPRRRACVIHGQREVYDSANATLDRRDQRCVVGGDLTRQVVIERPPQTCKRDQCGARAVRRVASGWPAEDDARGDDQTHRGDDARTPMLAEYKPREHDRHDVLQIEQEARRRAGALTQSESEEGRCEHTATNDRRHKPENIAGRQYQDAAALTHHAQHQHDRQPDARPGIEQTGKPKRVESGDESFCEWGARAK